MYRPRVYRRWVKSDDLVTFEVAEKETDLAISAVKDLTAQAREAILNCRKDIEGYIRKNSTFRSSLDPLGVARDAPYIVRVMADAAKKTGVGPMAAVAGAIAEFVGRFLLTKSDQVIVENGGDIFMKTSRARVLGVYAGGNSPFTGRLALEVGPAEKGIGVCTSSGTVSHSLSFGKADTALVISPDTALADAAATAIGNIVKNENDITKAIDFAKSIDGVSGVLIVVKDKMASWGKIKLV